PRVEDRAEVDNAFSFSSRGLWSNCNAGGQAAIAKIMTDPGMKAAVDAERAALIAMLDRRVATWNELAGPAASLIYPRYDGGFFTTVFCANPPAVARSLREEDGVYVVPTRGAVRVAMSSANEKQIPRIVEGLRRVLG
ncbi:MAG: aminotransferase class I/II-fold pyridoxal phosphate-dependent enzyme, partial [Myxococcota bacterium]